MAVYVDIASAQFENVNSLRRYPFKSDCSLIDSDGRTLPNEVICDVGLVVAADVPTAVDDTVLAHDQSEAPIVRLTGVHLSPAMISVCFLSRFRGRDNALSVTVAAENFRPYAPYRLSPLAGTSDAGGIVSFGNVSFPGQPEMYRFAGEAFDNAVIQPSCVCMAKPAALRSLIDRRSGSRIYGDVRIVFPSYIDAAQSGKSIALSLADGAASELASDCIDAANSNPCGATAIQSINNIRPDDDGNIVLWFH
jgi:hypothetical protein